MPQYRVKTGRRFHYVRIYEPGEIVDYPGPAGAALELVEGQEPWPQDGKQGELPTPEAESGPQNDLVDRLNRARSQSPDVVMRGDEPATLSDIQKQDRKRVEAEKNRYSDGRGLTRTEIIADLEGMTIPFDPRDSLTDLRKARNAGRAARDGA
jgi:hypothetical protein